ncbi:MAG: DUF4349 domain-containing protein [Chloroflexota bacterium]
MRRRALLSSVAAFGIIGAVACSSSAPSSVSAPSKPAEAPAPARSEAAKPADAAKPAEASKPASPALTAQTDADRGRAVDQVRAPAPVAVGAGAVAAQVPPGVPAPAATATRRDGPVPPQPAPQPAPGQAPADPTTLPAPATGRMVIYTTELSILVKDLGTISNAIGDIAAQAGGFVAGVEQKDENGRAVSTIRLKVPPDRYEPTMRALRALAVEVTDEKAATQDVTEEFNDAQTQIASLEASYAQILELMKRAQNMDEIVKLQDRLAQTKVQLDRVRGRANFLQRGAEFATITVRSRLAQDVLATNFTAQRTNLRKLESQRVVLQNQIAKARNPEEENTLRDRLAEVTVEIDRVGARLKEIESRAAAAGVTLPTVAPDDPQALAAPKEDELGKRSLELRAQLAAAMYQRDRLTTEIQRLPADQRAAAQANLQAAILDVGRLTTQLKVVQDRATQLGITLPQPTEAEIAALAGIAPQRDPSVPDPWTSAVNAWNQSLRMLGFIVTGIIGAVAFLWWTVPFAIGGVWYFRRRRAARAAGAAVAP